MTNFEKFIKEATPEKVAEKMMCPYEMDDERLCFKAPNLKKSCYQCCLDYLNEEAER